MRTGRDGKISYVVQKGKKAFGITKQINVESFDNYDSAVRLYNQLTK